MPIKAPAVIVVPSLLARAHWRTPLKHKEVYNVQTDNISPAAVQAASDGTAIIPPAMYATMAAATGSAPGAAPQAAGVSPFIAGSSAQAGAAQPNHFPNNEATMPMQTASDAGAQPQPVAQPQVIPPTQAGQVWTSLVSAYPAHAAVLTFRSGHVSLLDSVYTVCHSRQQQQQQPRVSDKMQSFSRTWGKKT